jgi:hypothetical protein
MKSEKQRLHLKKLNSNQKGNNNRNWKNGCIRKGGHRLIRVDNNYIFEHRYIIEKHLGRKLAKNEDVHHINHNPLDNRIENLKILTKSEHTILHRKLKKRSKDKKKRKTEGYLGNKNRWGK